MPLKPCRHCHKDISDIAEKCPKCGMVLTTNVPEAQGFAAVADTFKLAYKQSGDVGSAVKAVLKSMTPPPAPGAENPQPKYDRATQVKEFKRTCNECKKTWHSLSEREEELKSRLNPCKAACCGTTEPVGCTECRKGCFGVAGPDSAETLDKTLDSLKKCPNCGSGNYSEEIIIYERKK